MAKELSPIEQKQREMLKKAETVAVHLTPYEVHSRLALGYLQIWADLETTVPEEIPNFPIEASYAFSRMDAARLLGEHRDAQDSGAQYRRQLCWLRNYAKKREWTVKFEAEALSVPVNVLSGYVNHAFAGLVGFPMRMCDWRLLLQFTSPQSWARSKSLDFVLHPNNDDLETRRMVEIIGTMNLRARIPVHPEAFSTEFSRYLREHWQHQWTPHEYFEWRKAFIDGLRIAAKMAPDR